MTWWGHSSTTVEMDNKRIGTDPLFVDRLGHLRRRGPTPPLLAAELVVGEETTLAVVGPFADQELFRRSLQAIG